MEAVALDRASGDRYRLAWHLVLLAYVAFIEEALREEHAIVIWPDERADYEQLTAATRAALSVEACAAAWVDGRRLSLEQAVAAALAG
jgi:hypothetical protein